MKAANALMSWEFPVPCPVPPCAHLPPRQFPSMVRITSPVWWDQGPAGPAPPSRAVCSQPPGTGDSSQPQQKGHSATTEGPLPLSGSPWWRRRRCRGVPRAGSHPLLQALWLPKPGGQKGAGSRGQGPGAGAGTQAGCRK